MIYVYGYLMIGLLIGTVFCWVRYAAIWASTEREIGRPPRGWVFTLAAVAAMILIAVAWVPMLMMAVTGRFPSAGRTKR